MAISSVRIYVYHAMISLIQLSDSGVSKGVYRCLIPLFLTGPESYELTRIDKNLDSWLNSTQFMKILTNSHSP